MTSPRPWTRPVAAGVALGLLLAPAFPLRAQDPPAESFGETIQVRRRARHNRLARMVEHGYFERAEPRFLDAVFCALVVAG